MSEEKKSRIEELETKMEDIKKLVKEYRGDFEEIMKRRPTETAGIIFIAGLVLGLLLGASASRR